MTIGTQPTLRALLRDTALRVSQLASSDAAPPPNELRNRCTALIRDLDAALEARRASQDVRDDLVMAQSGLLDECALTYLPENHRYEWEAQPLQVERFGHHDAGTRVFNRLAIRMRESPPNIDLLECYSVVLGLGFQGHYASREKGASQRSVLIAALQDQIAQYRPATKSSFVFDEPTKDRIAWLRRLSQWGIAATACVTVAIAWLAFDISLNADVARLFASTSR